MKSLATAAASATVSPPPSRSAVASQNTALSLSTAQTTTSNIDSINGLFKNEVAAYLDAKDLSTLEQTNNKFNVLTQEYTPTFLKKIGLFSFMKSINESDILRLKPAIREQLLSNPINQAIPQQYISKYMKNILLNDGIPYKVFSNADAFCAILNDGSLLTWGRPYLGGFQASIPDERTVNSVFSTFAAFCAVLDDGSLVAWGRPTCGGTPPDILDERNVNSVFSTDSLCFLLKAFNKK